LNKYEYVRKWAQKWAEKGADLAKWRNKAEKHLIPEGIWMWIRQFQNTKMDTEGTM
jgi:hypothetical protein